MIPNFLNFLKYITCLCSGIFSWHWWKRLMFLALISHPVQVARSSEFHPSSDSHQTYKMTKCINVKKHIKTLKTVFQNVILPTRKECNHDRPPKPYRERSIGSLEGAAQTSFCGRFPEIPSILIVSLFSQRHIFKINLIKRKIMITLIRLTWIWLLSVELVNMLGFEENGS